MDATYIEYFTQGYLAECDNGSCETPVQANGITSDHFNHPLNTALNSTIGFDLASTLYLPEGTVVGAFYDLNNDGQIGGSPSINSMDEVYFECVGLTDFQNNFFTMAIWGDDSFSDEVDGVPGNAEDVLFAFLLPNQSVIAFDFSPENFAFAPNGLTAYSAVNLEVTVYGCTNPTSCNYNYYAKVDDGSCEGSYGCMEQMYVDYSTEASCHNQDMCADTWHDHLLVMETDYQDVMAALDSSISSNEDLSAALENQLELSSNLEIEMAAITLSLTQANQNMTELTENLEEAAANNANLEMVNEALEEANNNLTNLLNQANDALLSMEGEMIEVQADMVDANLTIDGMTTSMENLNAANIEMQVEMATANQTISNMTNAVDSLSSVNSEMQEGMSIANETLSNMSNSMDSLSSVNSEMQEGMSIANETLSNMSNSMDSLSSVNSEMQEGMSIANETISNMTNSMDSLSSVNSEMEVGMTELENTNSEMSSINESLQYELDNSEENVVNLTIQTENLLSENDSLAAPINIDLNAGWNIIGYTLRNAQDAVVSFENVIENISVVKNNSGDVYWPDFGFNGIGELLPGQGYQVLTFDAHNDFYFEDMGGLRTEIMPTIPQWAIEMEAAVHPNDVKTLVRVVNTLGQEVQPENEFEGRILYYLYNDGSVAKKVN
jgi:predicted  nucleic acid-binding Zn-ribbon protein